MYMYITLHQYYMYTVCKTHVSYLIFICTCISRAYSFMHTCTCIKTFVRSILRHHKCRYRSMISGRTQSLGEVIILEVSMLTCVSHVECNSVQSERKLIFCCYYLLFIIKNYFLYLEEYCYSLLERSYSYSCTLKCMHI